jgi:hypothetical protein
LLLLPEEFCGPACGFRHTPKSVGDDFAHKARFEAAEVGGCLRLHPNTGVVWLEWSRKDRMATMASRRHCHQHGRALS